MLVQKGHFPLFSAKQRMGLVNSLKGVDSTILYHSPYQDGPLLELRPEYFIVTEDYGKFDQNQADTLKIAESIKCKIERTKYDDTISVTALKEKILQKY